MSNFAMSVELYMSSPVVTVQLDDSLPSVQDKLATHRISSVAVIDGAGKPVGVVSRTDLIRHGRMEAGRHPKSALLVFPSDRAVGKVMTRGVTTVEPSATVREAARLMVERRQHRVYVVERDRLVGVFSTKEVMSAIAAARVRTPIDDLMHTPVFTVRFDEPVALATERLERAHVSGVVVVENEWPVGIFTQTESLLSAALPRDTPVDDVMSPAMLCLGVGTELHRAAAQANAMSARRVVATGKRQMMGILGGLDFARAAL